MLGKVEWYVAARGFGILSSVGTDGGLDRFYFHITKVLKSPQRIDQGQRAEFDVNPIPPKPGFLPAAMNVVITVAQPGVRS